MTKWKINLIKMGACVVLAIIASAVHAQVPNKSDLIAIDVLVQPDSVMIANAEKVNARLRQNYPQGYSLDATHFPHITLVQRYIRASDLQAVGKAVANAVKKGPGLPISLKAIGYASVVWAGVGLVVYVVDPSPELRDLENRIVSAVKPFGVSGGTDAAFVRAPGEQINADTKKWVADFIPASSGKNYQPHVTLGTAHVAFAKRLKAEPFTPFRFAGVNIAIYHLGNFGTAQQKLWSLR